MQQLSFNYQNMKKGGFFILIFLLSGSLLLAQDCDPKELAKLSGTWKAGSQGSTNPVNKTDLEKEREILKKIHQKISGDYSPVGLEVSYSYAYGFNQAAGRNWVANPFSFNMYFLEYECGTSSRNDRNYQPAISSSTQAHVWVNRIFSNYGYMQLFAADIPEDREVHYFSIEKWPEKADGFYQLTTAEPTEWDTKKEFLWIITKGGKLPFRALTKKEFIHLHLPQMDVFLKQLEKQRTPIDSTDLERSQYDRIEAEKRIDDHKKVMEDFEALLTELSSEELAGPAIIDAGQSWQEFLGFKKEGDSDILHLVVPDLSYYDKNLPKWAPQFFCINITYSTKEPVYSSNIESLTKVIDVKFFQSLLDKP